MVAIVQLPIVGPLMHGQTCAHEARTVVLGSSWDVLRVQLTSYAWTLQCSTLLGLAKFGLDDCSIEPTEELHWKVQVGAIAWACSFFKEIRRVGRCLEGGS